MQNEKAVLADLPPTTRAAFFLLRRGKAVDVEDLFRAVWPEAKHVPPPRRQQQMLARHIRRMNERLQPEDYRVGPVPRQKRYYQLFCTL